MSNSEHWFLVVEDSADDEFLAKRAFSLVKRPETLVVARDGEEALQILRDRESPALVLLDLKLPRLSGVDVLMAMQDDARLRTIPVIVLTSSNEMSDIAACYELGCNAFVRKPTDYDEFMATVTQTLNFWLGANLTLATSRRPR